MKNVNTAHLKSKDINDMLTKWLIITRPLHRLTEAEEKILYCFLRKRFEFSKDVSSDEIVDRLLFSTDVRKDIQDELGYKMGTFQNYLSSLRAKGVVFDNKINKKMIPNFKIGDKGFQLIFNFTING
jgi:hypothetical protein